jgi:Fur family ferric uptake transcriptional regulator
MTQQRNTKQRKMILKIVQAHQDHPSAEQIYLEVREADPKISRGTVYRNLKLLADNGEIRQVKVPSADRFDKRQDIHYHLLCRRCGVLIDAPMPYHDELDKALSLETGFLIEQHRTIFEGLCPACLQADSTASEK